MREMESALLEAARSVVPSATWSVATYPLRIDGYDYWQAHRLRGERDGWPGPLFVGIDSLESMWDATAGVDAEARIDLFAGLIRGTVAASNVDPDTGEYTGAQTT